MTKLDKYIRIHLGCKEYIESKVSNYYQFGDNIIRVSDHIGSNSSGNISVISDSCNEDRYIVHKHSNGHLTYMTYKEVKNFLKSLWCYRSLAITDNTAFSINGLRKEINDSISEYKKATKEVKDELNYGMFTTAQKNTIKLFLQQNKGKKLNQSK